MIFNCYRYNRKWLLIEICVEESSAQLDLNAFTVPEENESESYWQAPYLEQYLNADGTKRICDVYGTPEKPVTPCRLAFFIYRTEVKYIRTPYGEFSLENPEKTPKRLKKIIKFEKPD